MWEKLKTILKWRGLRGLQIWNRLPIRAQGGVTVLIPIIAVLVSFAFAIYGNLNRAARQNDIQRKFTAVRQYGDLLTLLVDAETGELCRFGQNRCRRRVGRKNLRARRAF